GNYENRIIQTNIADSTVLYGLGYAQGMGHVAPIVVRTSPPDWRAEYEMCRQKFSERECAPALQPPDNLIQASGDLRYTYQTSDLGVVQWCGGDLFCNDGNPTRTETMLWARRTNGQPIRLD